MTRNIWEKPVNLIRDLENSGTETWPAHCDVYCRKGADGHTAWISLIFPIHDTPTPLGWQCRDAQKLQYIGMYHQYPVVSIMLPADLQIPFKFFNPVRGINWLGRGNLSAWASQQDRLVFTMPVRYWSQRQYWNLPLKEAHGKMKILFVPLQLNLFGDEIKVMREALDLENPNYNFLLVILFTEKLRATA